MTPDLEDVERPFLEEAVLLGVDGDVEGLVAQRQELISETGEYGKGWLWDP
jgi:hypothetical protein